MMTTREIAETLGVTRQAVHRRAARRGMEPARRVGTVALWTREQAVSLRGDLPRGPKATH